MGAIFGINMSEHNLSSTTTLWVTYIPTTSINFIVKKKVKIKKKNLLPYIFQKFVSITFEKIIALEKTPRANPIHVSLQTEVPIVLKMTSTLSRVPPIFVLFEKKILCPFY